MKKLILLLSVLFIAFHLNAQYRSEYPYIFDPYYYEYNYLNKYDKQIIKNNHVKKMTETQTGKKEKISKIFEFDVSSNLSGMTLNHWMFGKIHRQYIYSSIQNKRKPDNISLNGKGKEIRKSVYTYNNDTLLTEHLKYKKGEFFAKLIYKYDSARITESEYYKKNLEQPKNKWVYEYYSNRSKKSSTLYKYGKIKYVWNYECKEEGELVKKHKDTTLVCENTVVDNNGNKTITFRKFNEKGKPHKEVYVYNKSNKLIESKYYNNKDIIAHDYVYNPDNSSTIWRYYNKHGNEQYRYENLYNSKNKLIEEASYRHQNIQTWKTTFNYNEKDLLISSVTLGKKDKLKHESKYVYDDHDLLLSQKSFKRNGKLKNETQLTYLFY